MASSINNLKRKARQQGFTVEKRNSGHLRWTAPDGQFTDTAATPSSQRGITNIAVGLRKIGFDPKFTKPKKEAAKVVTDIRAIPDKTPVADATESDNCPMDGCGKRFLHSKMAAHMLDTHGIYACTDCDKTFQAKQHLGRHTVTQHGKDAEGNALIGCIYPECDKMISPHPSALASHFLRNHGISLHAWKETQVDDSVPAPVAGDAEAPTDEAVVNKVISVIERNPDVDFESLMASLVPYSKDLTPEIWDVLGEWVQETRKLLHVLS